MKNVLCTFAISFLLIPSLYSQKRVQLANDYGTSTVELDEEKANLFTRTKSLNYRAPVSKNFLLTAGLKHQKFSGNVLSSENAYIERRSVGAYTMIGLDLPFSLTSEFHLNLGVSGDYFYDEEKIINQQTTDNESLGWNIGTIGNFTFYKQISRHLGIVGRITYREPIADFYDDDSDEFQFNSYLGGVGVTYEFD